MQTKCFQCWKIWKYQKKNPLSFTQRQFFSSVRLESPQERKKKRGSQQLSRNIHFFSHWNSAVRKVIGKYVKCKRHRARVGKQKMTEVPSGPLTPDEPTLTRVRVGLFRPIEVNWCRSLFKPHGVNIYLLWYLCDTYRNRLLFWSGLIY